MKVIFLDFDGVLNSAASFLWEQRKKTVNIANTLSPICTSNFQYIFDKAGQTNVVISSTWRKLHTLVELKNILDAYGVYGCKIIGKTPVSFGGERGREIRQWLDDNPNVTEYVIIDDDGDALNALNMWDEKTDEIVTDPKGHFFQTTWEDGLTLKQAAQIAALLRGEKSKEVKI